MSVCERESERDRESSERAQRERMLAPPLRQIDGRAPHQPTSLLSTLSPGLIINFVHADLSL